MSIAYGLDDEDRQQVEKIFSNVDQEKFVADVKVALLAAVDDACEKLTNYLGDEYSLQIDEIVYERSKKLVCALLRGEDLKAYGLSKQSHWNGSGEFAYDGEGVRASIVRDFKDQIASAEMLSLMESNERLEDENLNLRRERY